MKINFGQKQTDRHLFLVCGIESLQGVRMHLLKHSRVSNTRSRLPTSQIPRRLRTRIEINSWNNRMATGSHFNPLPILFARINSPPRPQTIPRAEQIWKSWACRVHKCTDEKVTAAGVTPHSIIIARRDRVAQGASCSRVRSKQDDGSTGSISEQTTPKDGHTSHRRGRMAPGHSADMHTFTGH